MTAPLLTIAIPTYSRCDSALARVRELAALPRDLPVDVLVIDNASADGTYDRLRAEVVDPRIRVLRNDDNLGLAGNLLRLVDESRGRYVLYCSDEDGIEESALRSLLDFCAERAPSFVCPVAAVGAKPRYRGAERTRELTPADFHAASFYLSGLTFDRDLLVAAAERMRALLPDNSAAAVYPQVLMAALAVARGNAWYLDATVTTQVDEHESLITDPATGGYRGVPGRWAQFRGYEQFFEDLRVDAGSAERVDAMRETMRARTVALLRAAAVLEVPGMAPYFEPAAPARRPGLRARIGRLLGR